MELGFSGPLSFLQDLRTALETIGLADGASVEVRTDRIVAGFATSLPSLALGMFTITNLSISTRLTIPFNGDPVAFTFAVAERHRPFIVTVSMFGGGGFFALELDSKGVKRIEASLEFGGSVSLDLVVASGGVSVMADGPSWHSYVNGRCFRGSADTDAHPVTGEDTSLLAFLERSDIAEWAEGGCPRDPTSADPATTRFWVLREGDGVVAVGTMTEWRRLPADVGVLTHPMRRGQGLARRLVGAMVAESLPSVGVVRYRALVSNGASLAVARRLGFDAYGQNFRARRRLR
ncbi:MAG: GNAT family N-acetyltransferase [Solirubrobacterales bacterium]